mmetsp:Transcript_4982/g.3610  ORF Transcript_4982/g.3610 Transcript_4982/m.3610 type:complete len:208 (+) Transcript_4982:725-1348(+)
MYQQGFIDCNEFRYNWSLIVFYLLYCCYWLISALQMKFGIAEMKKGNFMMWSYSPINKLVYQIYMYTPFLLESKTFADWTFTRTSLDVFQWFNIATTHATLFTTKCNQKPYHEHKLGEPQAFVKKFFIGGCGLFGIILLIAGPLLLFSTFNPISENNPVRNSVLKFNILIQEQNSSALNSINLYTNNYVQKIEQITDDMYDAMNFET